MKVIPGTILVFGVLASLGLTALGDDKPIDIKRDGAFGFPQSKAKVLVDQKELRFSVWNDAKYLYAQAVVWADGDDTLGETNDGRPIGDTSTLRLDVDGDRKPTAKVDRNYSLNPWPAQQGLRYSVVMGATMSSYLKSDSKGRGAIRYLKDGSGKLVRVDSYVIPLAEIEKKVGDKIRLAYYASSPKPELTLNSVGFKAKGGYYSQSLPWAMFHEVTLEDRPTSLDFAGVPEGRDDKIPVLRKPTKATAKVGAVPPDLSAKDWINADKPLTLASLKGRVVLVDFWATWCGPCVAGIPHLNKLHEELGRKGLTVVGVTEQSRKGIENFMKKTPMHYVVATGSEMGAEYGVSGLPHVFLIGRDGKLIWQGNPADKGFDTRIMDALNSK